MSDRIFALFLVTTFALVTADPSGATSLWKHHAHVAVHKHAHKHVVHPRRHRHRPHHHHVLFIRR